MLKNRTTRRGFTLPEVLVTVAIVAVLAAVVVPAVTQQVGKGDAPAFLGSAGSLRTAVASFAADVRKIPGQVSHLSSAPIADTDEDLATSVGGGTAYTAAIVARWRGPYESSGGATGVLRMGFGWTTDDDLVDSSSVGAAPRSGYLVVTLNKAGAVVADAVELDNAVDPGGIGADVGIIRWTPGVAPDFVTPGKIKLFLMSSAR